MPYINPLYSGAGAHMAPVTHTSATDALVAQLLAHLSRQNASQAEHVKQSSKYMDATFQHADMGVRPVRMEELSGIGSRPTTAEGMSMSTMRMNQTMRYGPQDDMDFDRSPESLENSPTFSPGFGLQTSHLLATAGRPMPASRTADHPDRLANRSLEELRATFELAARVLADAQDGKLSAASLQAPAAVGSAAAHKFAASYAAHTQQLASKPAAHDAGSTTSEASPSLSPTEAALHKRSHHTYSVNWSDVNPNEYKPTLTQQQHRGAPGPASTQRSQAGAPTNSSGQSTSAADAGVGGQPPAAPPATPPVSTRQVLTALATLGAGRPDMLPMLLEAALAGLSESTPPQPIYAAGLAGRENLRPGGGFMGPDFSPSKPQHAHSRIATGADADADIGEEEDEDEYVSGNGYPYSADPAGPPAPVNAASLTTLARNLAQAFEAAAVTRGDGRAQGTDAGADAAGGEAWDTGEESPLQPRRLDQEFNSLSHTPRSNRRNAASAGQHARREAQDQRLLRSPAKDPTIAAAIHEVGACMGHDAHIVCASWRMHVCCPHLWCVVPVQSGRRCPVMPHNLFAATFDPHSA